MYKLLFVALLLTFFITIALLAFQNKKSIQPNTEESNAPYSLREEEVSYENQDAGVILSGTLTLPISQKASTVVLLIHGYGKYDRNVTGMGHSYFGVLSDYLIKQGIGVLRFDKRGVGKSTGNYDNATTQDFANDVLAGVAYLKSREDMVNSQIGLIGLSEGGLIASMVAAKSEDISYIVMMAPAVNKTVDDLIEQTGLQLRADGATEEFIARDKELRNAIYTIVMQEPDSDKAEKMLQHVVKDYLDNVSEAQKIEASKYAFAFTKAKKDMFIKTFNSPWYRFFLSYNRIGALENTIKPVLVINGNLDWIASPHKIFPVISEALEKAGNKDYSMIELSNLNHMFQTAKTGSLAEYAAIEETIAPLALDTIAKWILEKVKNK